MPVSRCARARAPPRLGCECVQSGWPSTWDWRSEAIPTRKDRRTWRSLDMDRSASRIYLLCLPESSERIALQSARPALPRTLARAIERATDSRLERRYANVDALARDLLGSSAGLRSCCCATDCRIRRRSPPRTRCVGTPCPLDRRQSEPRRASRQRGDRHAETGAELRCCRSRTSAPNPSAFSERYAHAGAGSRSPTPIATASMRASVSSSGSSHTNDAAPCESQVLDAAEYKGTTVRDRIRRIHAPLPASTSRWERLNPASVAG